ncbi:unnamed protein product [Danaus chrysippus]|uniref:(African queen) hypothetical protein n=1 Tax=Danaus chrysippus TaxID=151541 RepID=A0A8J2R0S6_9NEOP|nr:unnamed protein product [Danaus chrysippus]
MKWRNSKERELLASGGSREQTLPNKNNPHPDLSDAEADRHKLTPPPEDDKYLPPATTHGLETRGFREHAFPAADDGEEYYSDASGSDEEIHVT